MNLLIPLLLLLSTAECYQPRKYIINLDEHPSQRWNEVIRDHLEYLPGFVEEGKKYIPSFAQPVVFWLSEKLIYLFDRVYREELRGIALESGLPLGEVVGFNILYDITAFNRKNILGSLGCTSMVVETSRGEIYHGRNLDYEMTDLLKNITIYADFQKNGTTIYSGITFAMYNGLLTGQRPKKFSVNSGAYIDNILMELYTRFRRPISYLIREVLETEDSFEGALDRFSSQKLVAPEYLILAGTKSGEGALISRLTAIRELKNAGRTNFDELTLNSVLNTVPVRNNLTIFTSVISPSRPELMYHWTNILNR